MGKNDDRDHYDRPSWKELDRRKDGRSDGGEGRPKRANRAGVEAAKQEYLKSIDGLFSPVSGEQKVAFGDLKAAHKSPDFTKLVQAYLASHGYPKDFEMLMLILDAKDGATVLGAAQALKELLVFETPARKSLFAGKIRLLKLLHDSPTLHLELDKLV